MSETLVTVVGNVATRPEIRKSANGVLSARFRLATTARRWDREQTAWTDGHTSFYTVWAWRQLGENVAGSVGVGEPVVVQGRLRVREEKGADGQRWTSAEIDAVAVGHDLARGTSAFRRMSGLRTELTSLTMPLAGSVPTVAADAGRAQATDRAVGSERDRDPGAHSSAYSSVDSGADSSAGGAAESMLPVGAVPPF
jgi:single-strand DNA-binding protein